MDLLILSVGTLKTPYFINVRRRGKMYIPLKTNLKQGCLSSKSWLPWMSSYQSAQSVQPPTLPYQSCPWKDDIIRERRVLGAFPLLWLTSLCRERESLFLSYLLQRKPYKILNHNMTYISL